MTGHRPGGGRRQRRTGESRMKVLGVNGSSRKDGNTAILIRAVFEPLQAAGIECELVQLAGKRVHGCTACRKCGEDGRRQLRRRARRRQRGHRQDGGGRRHHPRLAHVLLGRLGRDEGAHRPRGHVDRRTTAGCSSARWAPRSSPSAGRRDPRLRLDQPPLLHHAR